MSWMRSGMRPLRCCVLFCGVIVVLTGSDSTLAADPESPLRPIRQTVRDQVVFRRASYNYAPAVIQDGETFHLYWCGQIERGDSILHAEASALGGPWHAASDQTVDTHDVALGPTKRPADFDGLHVCDPNVVKIGARFFLYYGAAAADDALTAIGVAESSDGVHFARLNAGRPIVTAARTNASFAERHLTYGAGQPAAVYVAPYVYLAFTDSTGSGANPGNGAGQFALRSRDPAFRTDIEELELSGWTPRAYGEHTAAHSFLESFGMDWIYDPPTGTLIAASNRAAGHVTLMLLEPETLHPIGSADLAMDWREGPSLVAQSDKSTLPRATCPRLLLDVFSAEGSSSSPWTWHSIARSEGEYAIEHLCSTAAR